VTETPAGERAANRAQWQERAEAWLRGAPQGRSIGDEINQTMIAAAGIAPGHSVLDTAAGTGEPAISIALRLGEGGILTACDFAGGMLAGAERRAAALALGNIRFTVADMESLPFADRAFDALTCRFALMHVTDHDAAAAEARRVLKPGARAVYIVWGPVEDNTLFFITEPLIRAHLGEADPHAPGKRHSLGAPGAAAAILERAGFHHVDEREIRETRRIPVGERFWHARLERNFARQFAAMSATRRTALDDDITAAFEPYRDGDVFLIHSHARMCVGAVAG
jgi:SAM-dependent methyltransferase